MDMTKTSVVDELRAGRSVTYFTMGVSMRPLLRERETHVRMVPLTDARTPVENDILLYVRDNGQLVLHRLLKRDSQFLYMRGDNTYALEPIRPEQAIGVVEQIWRKGCYIDVATDRRYRAYIRWNRLNYPARFVWFKARGKAARIVRRVLRKS